jgi:hypothetical protein
MSYFQLMSQMTLDLGAGTSGTQYKAPHASSYDTPGPSTRVPETQAPADARHERHRHKIRPRDTYNPSLIRRMFRRRWCVYLFISETVVYIFILFKRLYFIFFIYGLKFSFSYLCFDINFLQKF